MPAKIASGDLPASSYSFGFNEGMIGNVHFVTIPANANAVLRRRLSPISCSHPMRNCVKQTCCLGRSFGSRSQKLPDGQRETLQSRMPQDLPPVLAEPHAGWVNALEQDGYTVTVRINIVAVAMMAVIYAPLIRQLHADIAALSLALWQALFADPQLRRPYWQRWYRQPSPRSAH